MTLENDDDKQMIVSDNIFSSLSHLRTREKKDRI